MRHVSSNEFGDHGARFVEEWNIFKFIESVGVTNDAVVELPFEIVHFLRALPVAAVIDTCIAGFELEERSGLNSEIHE